jgi:hypothetical protein
LRKRVEDATAFRPLLRPPALGDSAGYHARLRADDDLITI